ALAVDQSPNVMIEEEHNVTLYCSQKGTSYSGMYWYRQLPGQHLELIVYYYYDTESMEKKFEGRFSSERKDSSLYLTVRELKSADSAVYFCAKQEAHCYFPPQLQQIFKRLFEEILFVESLTCLLGISGCGQELHVSQTPLILWNNTGESVSIHCEHQGGISYNAMYWFRQLPGERIQLIVYSVVGIDPDFGELSTKKYDVKKTEAQKGSFTVKNLEPGDSVTYFCA
uniref:Ig-like domain-containing protein n=1 Tax=Lepisosteus oculatus TaxID=7918 RepID=W5N7D8_LEPOC